MSIFAKIVIFLIAAIHVYIAWFEIFAWTSRGPKVFNNFPKDLFEPTKSLAANQGIYNGFLAAGLLWSLLVSDPVWQINVAICFLLFVAVAGAFGAYTASRKTLYVQLLPALLGLVLVMLS